MIEELIRIGVDAIGANGIPIATVSVLAVAVLYGRRGLQAGTRVALWARMGLVVLAVLAVLLVTGIVPTIDVGALLDLVGSAVDVVSSLVGAVYLGGLVDAAISFAEGTVTFARLSIMAPIEVLRAAFDVTADALLS